MYPQWVIVPLLYLGLGLAVLRRDLERYGRLRLWTVLDWPRRSWRPLSPRQDTAQAGVEVPEVISEAVLEEFLGQRVCLSLVGSFAMHGVLTSVERTEAGEQPIALHLTSGGDPWVAPWNIVTMVWTEENDD